MPKWFSWLFTWRGKSNSERNRLLSDESADASDEWEQDLLEVGRWEKYQLTLVLPKGQKVIKWTDVEEPLRKLYAKLLNNSTPEISRKMTGIKQIFFAGQESASAEDFCNLLTAISIKYGITFQEPINLTNAQQSTLQFKWKKDQNKESLNV